MVLELNMSLIDSLRDIETSLKAQRTRWHYIVFKDITPPTLSEANNRRGYRAYEDFFYKRFAVKALFPNTDSVLKTLC